MCLPVEVLRQNYMFTRNPNPDLFVYSSEARHKAMKIKGYVHPAKAKFQAGHLDSSADKSRIRRFPNGRHRATYWLVYDTTRCVHALYKVTIPHEVLSVGVVAHFEQISWIWTSQFDVSVSGFLVKMLYHLPCLSVGFRTQSTLPHSQAWHNTPNNFA